MRRAPFAAQLVFSLLIPAVAAAEAPPVALLVPSGPLSADVLATVASLRVPTAVVSRSCLKRPRCIKKKAVDNEVDVLAVIDAKSKKGERAAATIQVYSARTGEPTRSVSLRPRAQRALMTALLARVAELFNLQPKNAPTAGSAAGSGSAAAAAASGGSGSGSGSASGVAGTQKAEPEPVTKMPSLVVTLDVDLPSKAQAAAKGKKAVDDAEAKRAASVQRLDGLQNLVFMLIVFGVLTSGFSLSLLHSRRQRRKAEALIKKTKEDGADQPPSLHPIIDPTKCIGCGSCVMACPDRKVLSVFDNMARLATPANCVGIGECKAICPADAITLVFGTSKRPVDLPRLDTGNQSTVPGLYIAGELGGMGLIANAFAQAIEVMDAIKTDLDSSSGVHDPDAADVLVVGAGPAGLGASLRAKELGLSYRCVDQAEWGGAIRAYPRGKLVMTRPIKVPLYGPVKMRETSKEALVETFTRIVDQTGVKIESGVRVEKIDRGPAGVFVVRTSRGAIKARRVLLAIGRRGTPRKLGVAGENDQRVAYVMTEPDRWANQQLVVVGGGDVACETALALAEQPGTTVSMLYRGSSLSRPKPGNRERIAEAVQQGKLELVLGADVKAVTPSGIQLATPQRGAFEIPADKIFACLGGNPPTKFLSAIGIEVVTFTGQPAAA
ncbi:MAG: NAD(P)-binding domain-containing protein [Myxococcales bacterium]|nr:NAD(P)-binding domain-containing protein [Myxococcales bacterium]